MKYGTAWTKIYLLIKKEIMAKKLFESSCFIVTDPCYQKLLLQFKDKHPDFDCKLLTKEELIDRLSFSYSSDPIPYLLTKEKYDYSRLKQIVKILRVADASQNEELQALKTDLELKGYLQKDEYGSYELQKKKIYLFEDDEDLELKGLLKRSNLSFEDLHFEDLDFKTKYETQPTIYLFSDKFLQFTFIYSDIRSQIVKNGFKPSDISIILKDSTDYYYVSLLADIFNIKTGLTYSLPLINDEEVKKTVEDYCSTKKFVFPSKIQKGSAIEALKRIVDTYQLDKLPDQQFAFSNLQEILASYSVSFASEQGLVQGRTDIDFDPNSLIYVTDFQHDVFYSVHDDTNIYSDQELVKVGANPSYALTRLDRRKKLNYIKYMNISSLSRVKLHLSDKIYDSQFLEEMKWKAENKSINEEGLYTNAAIKLLSSKIKDDFFEKKTADYKDYDHSYQLITSRIPFPKEFSVTAFNDYFKCPFYYYLNKVLKLEQDDPFDDTYLRDFGSFCHFIFENIYSPTFDFDIRFKEAKQDFIDQRKKQNIETGNKELAFLDFSYFWLSHYTAIARMQFTSLDKVKEAYERPVTFSLTSSVSKRNYHLKGRIDKLVFTPGCKDRQYYTILDYKTGSETFNIKEVFLGGSLQLPLYAYALTQDENAKEIAGYEPTGFGIQHIIQKTPVKDTNKTVSDKAFLSVLKTTGVTYLSMDYLSFFDKSALKSNGKDISARGGQYLRTSVGYGDKDSVLCPKLSKFYSYQYLMDDALKASSLVLDHIYDQDFSIAPLIMKAQEDPFCSNCSYRDICYRNKDDIKNVQSQVQLHFHCPDNDDSDDSEESD